MPDFVTLLPLLTALVPAVMALFSYLQSRRAAANSKANSAKLDKILPMVDGRLGEALRTIERLEKRLVEEANKPPPDAAPPESV